MILPDLVNRPVPSLDTTLTTARPLISRAARRNRYEHLLERGSNAFKARHHRLLVRLITLEDHMERYGRTSPGFRRFDRLAPFAYSGPRYFS